MDSTTATTPTLGDLLPVVTFLLDNPRLPAPCGVSIAVNGDATLNAVLESPAQVKAWAEAIGADVNLGESNGVIVHSAYTFQPFYISAAYCDRANEREAVSS